MTIKPELNVVYIVELCSGERRRWRYLACSDDGERSRWRDEESRAEFNEASLMYAWRIVARDDQALTEVGRES